jgi:hypothetical protein
MFKQISLVVMLAFTPIFAAAQTVQEQIIAQLTDQGFANFEISRTFLGRVRVVTQSDRLQRELVFNPKTGEMLRDYWEPLEGSDTAPQIQLADPNGSSSDNEAASAPNRPTPPRPPRNGPRPNGPRPDGPRPPSPNR